MDFETETLIVGTLGSNGKAAGTATAQDAANGHLVATTLRAEGFDASEDGTGRGIPLVPISAGVRRLLPIETERLQGLPDGWTAISYRRKPAADGPRYRSIGNSMAVPVMAWILDRVRMVGAA